jgi:hypothetical protein
MRGLAVAAALGLAALVLSSRVALGPTAADSVALAQVVPGQSTATPRPTPATTRVPSPSPTRVPTSTPVSIRPTATPTRPASLAPSTNPAPATGAPPPLVVGAAQIPRFVLGFAFLKDQLGPIMGVPLEAEHGSPDSCDTRQRTSTGLAYWRCSINAMAFAAAPDGLHHWAWTGRLVSWVGTSPEPPPDAQMVVPLVVTATSPDASCATPAVGPVVACAIESGLTLPGYIREAGQTDAYRFAIRSSTMHVLARLSDLPADYDLYLTDEGGSVLGESVTDGTAPEEIDTTLGAGVYYLYVHNDPSRPFDDSSPFEIHLELGPDQTP